MAMPKSRDVARKLDVYMHGRVVGVFEQDDSGQLGFQYAKSWLAGPSRLPLSQSLPLRSQAFDNREARPFFAGLLPEGEKRDLVARALGVSARNDFALLDGIGGECAGAITFVEHGATPSSTTTAADYRPLDDEQIAKLLDKLPERPLLAGEEGVRLSLAGAQDKLPVLVVDGKVALPLHGAPSSHILKPPIPHFDDTVHNEGFCLALAKALGLHVINSEIGSAKGKTFLLVERYDRHRDAAGTIIRRHQEDLCQALGIPPELKYQAEGGPSLQQCFDVVRRSTTRPVIDLARLLDAVLFNLLSGNNDAHGKNYSLLFGPNGVELAPIYDVLSTAAYRDLAPRLAMKIDDRYEFADLFPRHWDRFAKEAGLGAPQLRRRLIALARRLPDAARQLRGQFVDAGLDRPVIGRILAVMDKRTRMVLKRFETEPRKT